MKRVMFMIGMVLAGVMTVGSASASVQVEDNLCLGAPDARTYTLCAALESQPSYNVPGTDLARPTGSELIALIAEEGITPEETPREFRREARGEIADYFAATR